MKRRKILYKMRRLEANYKAANVSLATYDGKCFFNYRSFTNGRGIEIFTSLFSKHATVTVEFQIR